MGFSQHQDKNGGNFTVKHFFGFNMRVAVTTESVELANIQNGESF